MMEDKKNHTSTESQSSAPARLEKKKLSNAHKGLIVGGTIVLCLFLLFAAVSALATYSGTVLPNTTIAGVKVGGLSYSELEGALKDAQDRWKEKEDAYLVFEVENPDGENLLVQVPANYIELDQEASAQRVWEEATSDGSFFVNGVEYIRSFVGGNVVTPEYLSGGQLDVLLAEEVDAKIGHLVEESTAAVTENKLELTKGKPGREVDKEKVKEELFALMAESQTVDHGTREAQFQVQMVETLPEELDMEAVYEEYYVEPQDASVNTETGFKMEVVGISFDIAAAQEVFDQLDWGEKGELDLILTEPNVKLTDLEEYLFQDLLGACSTNIGGSANRLSNVTLAASSINGKILSPGEKFSYDGIVGRRTSARGYLPAPAYVGGQTVDEVGGGICQVSSTLYLATLRSNLEMVERHNHGYTVGYVPNGLDATVYYGSLDFRFKNNTQYPIKISASVSGRTLNVNVYGTNPEHISVKMETEQTGTKDYKTVYQIDDSVPVGSTKTKVTPYTGCTVKSYRCVYKNGNLVSRTLESTSVYNSRDKVVLVNSADGYKYGLGPAPEATPEPTPEQPEEQAEVTPPAA